MKESVGNYSWGSNASRRLRKRGTGLVKYSVVILGIALAWFLWITRDVYPISNFILQGSQLEFYIHDIMEKQEKVLKSKVFQATPDSIEAKRSVSAFSEDIPLPRWLLNNLNHGVCYISRSTTTDPRTLLVVTRMTRIGCLAERILRLFPEVTWDYAGGLNLYRVQNMGVYYAVRGRTFLLSPDRGRLIEALTIVPEHCLDKVLFEENSRVAGNADLYCRMLPHAWPSLEPFFSDVTIAFRIEPDALRLMLSATFTPRFTEQCASILPVGQQTILPAPFDAMAAVSLNFGRPLPEVLQGLNLMLQAHGYPIHTLWPQESADADTGSIAHFQRLLVPLLQSAGPTARLGWFGVDALEMVPTPLVAATFQVDIDTLLLCFERINPPNSRPSEGMDWSLVFKEELMMAHAPFVGGPNMKPTIAKFRDGILLSTSLPLAERLQENPSLVADFKREGNLFIHARPLEIAESILSAAKELAASGLLKGYNEETLQQVAQPWLTFAHTLQSAVLLASWNDGRFRAEIKLATVPTDSASVAVGKMAESP